MLYVGKFSFDVVPDSSLQNEYDRGFFTTLVEADSPDEAVEKFESLIRSVDESEEAFEGIGDIYLDFGIEVRQLPEEGLITYLEFHGTDGLSTLSTNLRGAPREAFDRRDFSIFEWGPEPTPDDEVRTAVPFLHHRD